MAQLSALDLSSGHDIRILRASPVLGFALSGKSASEFSLPICPSPVLLYLPNKQTNKTSYSHFFFLISCVNVCFTERTNDKLWMNLFKFTAAETPLNCVLSMGISSDVMISKCCYISFLENGNMQNVIYYLISYCKFSLLLRKPWVYPEFGNFFFFFFWVRDIDSETEKFCSEKMEINFNDIRSLKSIYENSFWRHKKNECTVAVYP